MMGQIPETDDSNKMEVETEVETEMMSDDEVASAVQGAVSTTSERHPFASGSRGKSTGRTQEAGK